ncbi:MULTISPECIES: CBS domain-containing protein [Nitrosomonas]|uniref:CBS domain protein n=2 Tax=Nitrosomonas eutropha TaxID=916 RepID=A0ABX5MAU0_9PROT|nr:MULTISPECIES: CBS domain-containing protein [Nitrosomonas]ABI59231.1 putative signal-transduction protein with CBS domains [Nitrosomonas eutropha C91]MXS79286.1 CBS domain-containing protein [Nitrosomonas sp. GH22]PXV83405.1 CBS domain protein [Nitrosomonas eutropha]SDW63070.1 CBS domain-containing protein [Nitrosomonas eutropha]SEI61371.1 CBS domain-containing protein [Nitrosomonas eutropha]
MTVSEICNREVRTIQRDGSVLEAARMMRQYHVGALIVIDKVNDRVIPVGVITDRDLVVEVLATGLDKEAITVDDVMTQELFAVKENTAIHDAINFMRRKTIRRLPIINDNGELVGILTTDDIMEILSEEVLDLAKLIRYEHKKEIRHRP